MKPAVQPSPANHIGRIASVTLLGAAVALFAIVPFVSGASDAAITVVFDADDMGFTATSSKTISNIVVVDCAGDDHKHDGLTGQGFVHREASVIAYVYVKSGNNANNEPGSPSGSGERFNNVGACDEETTSSSSSTTAESTTTTAESSSTTAESSSTTAESTTTTAESSSTTAESSSTTAESTTTTAESSSTTAESSTTTAESTTTTVASSTTDDNNTEVPFFTSPPALALGFGGSLVATLLMLRRRL